MRVFTSSRSHFVQVETDDLRVAQIEPGRFLQDDIRFNGIQQRAPDIVDGMFLIGVLDALVLPDLRAHIGQQRHGIALRLQCLMHMTPFKKSIHHFPP